MKEKKSNVIGWIVSVFFILGVIFFTASLNLPKSTEQHHTDHISMDQIQNDSFKLESSNQDSIEVDAAKENETTTNIESVRENQSTDHNVATDSETIATSDSDAYQMSKGEDSNGSGNYNSGSNENAMNTSPAGMVSLSDLPAYNGSSYVAVNQNIPFFTDYDNTTQAFEYYSELDSLGRCGVAYANICREIMPTEERGKIGSVKPSGWQSVRYDIVDGAYLYNRCHLIAYQLAGENANERNLITGTRYLNVEGMLPFENMVADYVKETNHHVLYRVTPIFDGNNLLASGVLMEAKSVEDNGAGILFNVFCYNIQPGIIINYQNGDNSLAGNVVMSYENENMQSSLQAGGQSGQSGNQGNQQTQPAEVYIQQTEVQTAAAYTYVLNSNTKKYHRPDCSSVPTISPKNRIDFNGDINEMIRQGYQPCKKCNP